MSSDSLVLPPAIDGWVLERSQRRIDETNIFDYMDGAGELYLAYQQDSAKLGEIWNLPHVKGKTRLILVDALHPLCDKGPRWIRDTAGITTA